MSQTYTGEYRDGVVVFPDGLPAIPEGSRVEVVHVEADEAIGAAMRPISERYADIIGIAEGLPEDFASEHDHYIHGTPRRGSGS